MEQSLMGELVMVVLIGQTSKEHAPIWRRHFCF